MNKDVAVVIPVFNRARTVLDALDSVAAQTVPPARVVVVDDGSTDDTAQRVREWIATHERNELVQLVCQANGGAAAARNAGLSEVADHGSVAFLDSDDMWPADFLDRTSRVLNESRTAVAASCDRLYVSTKGVPDAVDGLRKLADRPTQWLFAHGGGVLSCSLLRTEAVRSLRGFDPGLLTGHDSELLLRLSTLGAWLHCPGNPVTFRRGVADSHGESDHLCKSFSDHKLRWARIYEHFAQAQGGADVLPRIFYRRELARRWSHAARQLITLGRMTEARECFKRSVKWQYRTKTLLRLVLTYLRSDAR